MKGYCSIRRESICCSENTIGATSEDDTVVVEHKDTTDSEDNLFASSPTIEEVDPEPQVSVQDVSSQAN